MLATARDIESLRELSERYGDQVKLFELDVTDESSAAGFKEFLFLTSLLAMTP